MAIAKTTVTGPILDATGAAYVGAYIRFTPSAVGRDDAEDTVIAQGPVEVATNASTGAFSIDLAPSDAISYRVDFVASRALLGGYSQKASYKIGLIYVPSSGPVALEDLLPVYSPDLPTNAELLAALSSAVSSAQSASTSASGFADDASDEADRSAAAAVNAALGTPYGFETVPLLIADDVMSYTAGAGLEVVTANQYLLAGGFRYQVAASGATDHHVTTDGAVKLYVVASDGRYNARAFGAAGNGSTNDAVALQKAATAAVAGGISLYIPAGTYLISGGVGLANNRIEIPIPEGGSLVIYGDQGLTIIKEADGDTDTYGAFHFMLYATVATGVTAKNISISGIEFDKNGDSNGTPSPLYENEQSHALYLLTFGTGVVEQVTIRDVTTRDKVGGGIVFGAGRFKRVHLENCHGLDFSGKFGQRGDVEFQATIDQLTISHCSGEYIQCEPDASTPGAGIFPTASLNDCNYDVAEFTGYSGAVTAMQIHLKNVKAPTKLTVRDGLIKAIDTDFQTGSANDEYWTRTAKGSILRDCKVTCRYDSDADTISPFYPRSEATGGGMYLDIEGGEFIAGAGATSTSTGEAIRNSATYSGAQDFVVRCTGVDFDPLFTQTVYAYANGNYEFIKCRLAGRSAVTANGAIRVGAYSSFIASVLIEDCDLSQITSARFLYLSNANALWSFKSRGVHDYGKFTVTWSAAGGEAYCEFGGVWLSNAAPSGQGLKGMTVRVRRPDLGGGSEYRCTTSSPTAATFSLASSAGSA